MLKTLKYKKTKAAICENWLNNHYSLFILNTSLHTLYVIVNFFNFAVPDEFQFDPMSKTYGDPSRRPEIKSATIEFIAPSEYMVSDWFLLLTMATVGLHHMIYC